MRNEIILERKLTAHQKTHVAIVLGVPIIIVIIKLLNNHFERHGIEDIFRIFTRLVPLVIALFSVIMILFLKSVLLKKGNSLYSGTYIFGKLLFKKKVNLTNKTKLATLKLNKRQKMAWFSIANPDQGLSYYKNDITLLNDKHTRKILLVSLSDEVLAQKAVTFLEKNFDLIHEVYSPDFS
ncbi:hypothetical protein [Tenacibaculum agarivorans]|uniref:hypothetical protein n=1 Tax=Tenacibaculum agarivorans TaxID=1908389 RepID=UPI00094BBE6C|nr:hypothetical protein [Tenacibaculum agarivorans]